MNRGVESANNSANIHALLETIISSNQRDYVLNELDQLQTRLFDSSKGVEADLKDLYNTLPFDLGNSLRQVLLGYGTSLILYF